MIVRRVEYAATGGFALDVNHIKHYMREIANDKRNTYKHNIPCNDTVRTFRAGNLEITLRKSENHSHKYILG